MTASEFVTKANLLTTGKRTAPAVGTPQYKKYLDLGNMFIDQWQNELGQDWASLYDESYSLGAVTATDSFDIDASAIRKLSDKSGDVVRISWTDGVGYTDYRIVPHDDLKTRYGGQTKQYPYGNYCAQIGSNLVFNHTFVSTDKEFGGTINVPVYLFADPMVSKDDDVPVDDPMWLVYMTCIYEMLEDPKKQVKLNYYTRLADRSMQRMKDNNDAQGVDIPTPWTPFSGFHNEVWS